MKTLKEIKEQFEATNVRGDEVNILAYHPEQKYPIIAEFFHNNKWSSIAYTEEGNLVCGVTEGLDLVPKKTGIDYSKLPKDTLCEVVLLRGGAPILRYSDGCGMFYQDGKTSKTRNPSHRTMEYFFGTKVVENEPVAWFGGECPIPKGVKFKVWLRGGLLLTDSSWSFNWSHRETNDDIIAYQVLGEL